MLILFYRHSTLPFLFCGISGTCQYASRNDFTYWLAGDVRQPMMPVTNDAVEPFVSRCVVCEAPEANIAVHSQDESTPECPLLYESLWTGFSFMMVWDYLLFQILNSLFHIRLLYQELGKNGKFQVKSFHDSNGKLGENFINREMMLNFHFWLSA